MSSVSRGKKSPSKLKAMGNEDEFLSRITKSLYYSKLPMTDRLSLPVTEFAAELFSEIKSGCTLERLDVEEASRISRNACVSPCSFVLALLYLERLKDCNPEYLYKVAPSELFLVSLMIASKFLNDDGEEDEVFNTEWAQSGDLTVPHMNKLEKEFLNAINWRIFVQNHQFWDRLRQLERDVAYKEGRKRGWFSYCELSCLVETIKISCIVQALVSISSVCLAAYTAGVVTLLGSALIASQVPGTSLAQKASLPSRTIENYGNLTRPSGAENFEEDPVDLDKSDELSAELRNFSIPEGPYRQPDKLNDSWNWWLPPLSNFLEEYSTNEEDGAETGIPGSFVASFVTNSEVIMGDHNSWSDLVTEINWRETLDGLQGGRNSWQYYVELVTRISVGQ